MSFITTKFHEILSSVFRGSSCAKKTIVSFILAKFLSSKTGVTPRKKMESKFPVDIRIHTLNVLHYDKVSRNSIERFQRSCANKIYRTDGLTDWLTDGSKTLYPPLLVAWGIKTLIFIIVPLRRWINTNPYFFNVRWW